MSIEEISTLLLNAERPIEVFGGSTVEDVRKKYKEFSKLTHPDIAPSHLKSLAEKTQTLLNGMYEIALVELENNLYTLRSKKDIYQKSTPLFEFKIKDKEFKFYEQTDIKDVYAVYTGLNEGVLVDLYLPLEQTDSNLATYEYKLLSSLTHLGIPKVINKVKINGIDGFIIEKPAGLTAEDLINNYTYIEDRHIAWILERLLSLIGFLHSNGIVHGNIKPENIYIDVDNHNVVLVDYSLSISKANESTSKYKIINENYSPSYINSSAKVYPSVDTYAVGLVSLALLGGDIESKGMPVNSNIELRKFIRKLINEKCNDAWALWSELIELREKEFGVTRFEKLELKKKVGKK